MLTLSAARVVATAHKLNTVMVFAKQAQHTDTVCEMACAVARLGNTSG